MAEDREFKFGTQLGFANKIIIKSHPDEKWGWPWVREAPKILVFPIIFLQRLGLVASYLARSWGLPRPIIKSHAKERVGVDLG